MRARQRYGGQALRERQLTWISVDYRPGVCLEEGGQERLMKAGCAASQCEIVTQKIHREMDEGG